MHRAHMLWNTLPPSCPTIENDDFFTFCLLPFETRRSPSSMLDEWSRVLLRNKRAPKIHSIFAIGRGYAEHASRKTRHIAHNSRAIVFCECGARSGKGRKKILQFAIPARETPACAWSDSPVTQVVPEA